MEIRLGLILSTICLLNFGTALGDGLQLGGGGPMYEVAPQKALDLTDEVTLEAWVKAGGMPSGGGRILDKSLPGGQDAYMLDTYPGNSLRFLNAKGMCRYKANLPGNRWTHVAGVYSASKKIMKLYMDGKEVASLDRGDFPKMRLSRAPLRVGADPKGANRFAGHILRAAVYGRALTAKEVAARAASKTPSPLKGVLGEWAFSGKPGKTISPASGKLALRIAGGSSSVAASTVLAGDISGNTLPPEEPMSLWYPKPAEKWTEALPIGNGRFGAMVFGGIDRERIQFNDDTLYTGEPHDYAHKGAVMFLPELRRLLFEGKQSEAHALGNREFMSVSTRGTNRQEAYQPFADLVLDFPGFDAVEDYRRDLNIDQAVSSVRFKSGGVEYRREVFASHPDDVIVTRLEASRAAGLSFQASLACPHAEAAVTAEGENSLVLSGVVERGKTRFEARLVAEVEGNKVRVTATDEGLEISGADAVTLVLVGSSSYVNYRDISGDPTAKNRETLKRLARKSYATLHQRHVDDYQSLFRRVKLDLGTTEKARLATDKRVKAFSADDPQLASLFFQYGRYLLIACSRPGGQPANLQGLWNESKRPPWDSKYTININTEMNYWPSELTNLAECGQPLFEALRDLGQSGRSVAKEHYGARGWVLHHNFDVWRGAAPINNANHGIWVTGGAWLAQHLWWHYAFGGDREFLSETAYPLLKEASLFFVDYLIEDPRSDQKWLISGPSNSPETGGLVMGPTMDHQIIRELFSNTIEASRILGVDEDLRKQLADLRARIIPNQIGQYGQLQEWVEDKDNPRNKHRHVSHLWGLHPGKEIHPRTTPELSEAAKVTLSHRGDGGTGWSKAWKINFWARLLDGDHAYKMLAEALTGNTYPNLFDAHPPFQIDGNFGATSGITEMLLQGHLREIDLLPALPSAWPAGSVSGLRTAGGFDVAITWRDGNLVQATIHSRLGKPCKVRLGDTVKTFDLKRGDTLRLDASLDAVR